MMVAATPAGAASCTLKGTFVRCDDGRTGTFRGDAIVWPDGTLATRSRHPGLRIGNSASVRIGPGVFVGQGTGLVPLQDPNGPLQHSCVTLLGLPYCP